MHTLKVVGSERVFHVYCLQNTLIVRLLKIYVLDTNGSNLRGLNFNIISRNWVIVIHSYFSVVGLATTRGHQEEELVHR